MTKVRTWVGLDVHAAKTPACVVDAESGEMTMRRLRGGLRERDRAQPLLVASGPRVPVLEPDPVSR